VASAPPESPVSDASASESEANIGEDSAVDMAEAAPTAGAVGDSRAIGEPLGHGDGPISVDEPGPAATLDTVSEPISVPVVQLRPADDSTRTLL